MTDTTTKTGIWPLVPYADKNAGIRFLTEAFGFTEAAVVHGDDDEIEPGEVDKLREVADGAEVVSDVVRFPDDEHRFDRDPDLAEEARRRACNWFDLHLR